jgi:hypothetical protein
MAHVAHDRRLLIAEGSKHDIAAAGPEMIVDAVVSLANRP